MPIFEFSCDKCGHQFEQLMQNSGSAKQQVCPKCQGPSRRKISVFSAHSNPNNGPCGQSSKQCGMSSDGGCSGGACPYSQG